jgi:replication-associated recombination protein RarA
VSLLPLGATEQTSFGFPLPLAEKYRPRRVSDFLGLEKPKKVLGAFCQRPTSSAWLFVGPSGTGKSTMALAIAETLKAELHHIPSQKCTAGEIDYVIRQCWYVPSSGGFHLVLVDEADRMSDAAQLALLSKLDSTDPPPATIFVFTANETEHLEKTFLSRCRVLEFSSYGLRDSLAVFLAKVWEVEMGKLESAPNFERMAKDSTNNVRDALMRLEVEILGA